MLRCIRTCLAAVAALALATLPVSAQKELGIHAGASIATFGGADAGSPNSRTGVNVGASLTLPVARLLGIQVGAGFVQKGATQSSGGVDVTLAVDYVEVPVLLRVGIPSSRAVSAHVLVGPAVAFQTSCKANGSAPGMSVSVDCSQIGADLQKTDVGAMGGVGLDLAKPGRLTVSIDALYNVGLSSIVNGADTKNRAFTIQAGLGIPLG